MQNRKYIGLIMAFFLHFIAITSCSDSNVKVDLSGAEALIIGAESGNSSLKIHPYFENITVDDAVSNLLKLLADNTLAPVVSGDPGIIVLDTKVSPTGEVYLSLTTPDDMGVRLAGKQCYVVMVDVDNSTTCVVSDRVAPFIYGFDLSGNVYLTFGSSSVAFDIAKWSPADKRLSILITKEKLFEINFSFPFSPVTFVAAPDGSLFLIGNLEGTTENLFRYHVNSSQLDRLTQSLLDITPDSSGFEVDGLDILNNGNLYVAAAGKYFYKGSFDQDGSLSFQFIGQSNFFIGFDYKFARTQNGEVFLITENEAIRIEPSIQKIELPGNVDKLKLAGESIYVSGMDDGGQFFFIRKDLQSSVETDLLLGNDLLVQSFDISGNGDVFFGALNFNTTERTLFRYVDSTNELEKVSDLPYDIADFFILQ